MGIVRNDWVISGYLDNVAAETEVGPSNDAESAPPSGDESRQRWNTWVAVLTILILVSAVAGVGWFAATGHAPTTITSLNILPKSSKYRHLVGIKNLSLPSGEAPPGPNALAGYRETYVNNFEGTSLPKGWYVFTGIPGGDPGGQFASTHLVVSDGLLRLNTWKDPKFANKWVTAGLCQCGLSHVYGAYFVRSRVTGAGPNEVELLWPASNMWPPEIDFNETGASDISTSTTVHFGATNAIEQRSVLINMRKWHTWGVIWTPRAIRYLVDGVEWSEITTPSEIPDVPMTLDIEQRTMCTIDRQCPTAPVSMLVDWVAEYVPNTN